ncbi:XYPPX repeat protein [Teladorsagia circumcincta]|uniref:Rhodopsin n=1 Tax=Teladorsagia circumcincta TaxID=45464 RepID=A0A2G9V1R2_TELCI|nr:XYPPX repeat protein [Teladorsagia circumcincta]
MTPNRSRRRPITTKYSSYPRDDPAPYYPYPYAYQRYPPQGYAPYGYPPYGYPSQYYPPEGYPPDGYSPEGYPPQGYPPEGYPPQGYPPQGYPPKGYSREDSPAEDSHPKKRRSRSRESDRSGGHPKGQKITKEIIKLKGKEQNPNVFFALYQLKILKKEETFDVVVTVLQPGLIARPMMTIEKSTN